MTVTVTKPARPRLGAFRAALMHARSHGEAVQTLERALHALWQPNAHAVVWRMPHGDHALFESATAPLPPLPATLAQLQRGKPARQAGLAFLPLLVGGALRGWIALDMPQPPGAAGMSLAAHAAGVLALWATDAVLSRESTLLTEVGRLVRGTLSLPELLERLGDLVCGSLEGAEFSIALLDESGDDLRFAYARRPSGVPALTHSWGRAEGMTGVVLRNNQVLNVSDYRQACIHYGISPIVMPNLPPVQAWLGVPLVHQEQPLGVMVVASRAPMFTFSTADEQFMMLVADQAAAAIANAQLYAHAERQTRQLRLINRIGRTISATLDGRELPMLLAHELQSVTQAADVQVLVETSTGDLEVRAALADPALVGYRVPLDLGLLGGALLAGHVAQATQIGDARLDTAGGLASENVLCVPLQGGEIRGVIALRNKASGVFDLNDEHLLVAVAEQAALALANADRYGQTDQALAEQLRTLARRNMRLNEMVALGNVLQTDTNFHHLTQALANSLATLTDAPRLVVMLRTAAEPLLQSYVTRGLNDTTSAYSAGLPVAIIDEFLHTAMPIGTLLRACLPHPRFPGFQRPLVLLLPRPKSKNGALAGLLVFERPSDEPLDPSLTQTLDVMANQAAIALNNVMLLDEQEQTVDRLTALNALSLAVNTAQLDVTHLVQMTVSGAIGTTGSVGGGALIVDDDDAQVVHSQGRGAGIDQTVWALAQQIEGDYLEVDRNRLSVAGVERLLIVPLRGAKLTVGVLWLAFGRTMLEQAEREMAVLYAKMSGAVIENLNLFAAVRAARDRMAAILASTREGMLMFDADGRVTIANRAFGELIGMAESRVVGLTLDALCTTPGLLGLEAATSEPLCNAAQAVLDGSDEPLHGEFSLNGAMLLDVAWDVMPAQNVAGRRGALLVLHDVTADRQIEKLRQDMSHMLVHDLRSPLTNMMMSVDLLLKRISGPLSDDQVHILDIAKGSCQQMLELINALLDIRRLQSRSVTLQAQPTLLAPIANTVYNHVEQVAAERRVRCLHELAGMPPVLGDGEMIRRVLQNLVDNALKFSPSGKAISMSARVVPAAALPVPHAPGAWAVVAVQDHGPGIPAAYRAVIFELFGQAPSGKGRGTGLGLAFCKLAIEAHGGTIWVENGPEDGSIFSFTLPVAEISE